MMTHTAAGFFVTAIAGTQSPHGQTGEYFPEMEEALANADRHPVLRSAFSAVVGAPKTLKRLATGMVPSSIRAAAATRAEARELALNVRRLEGLAPHLLRDIGIEQVTADIYRVIDIDEPAAEALPVEPAVIRVEAPPVARRAKAAPKRAPKAFPEWAPGRLAGTATA